jgi:hypothetical protein
MFELQITYDETTGNVNVNGPVHNKGVCYLMLECARDAVKDHVDKAANKAAVVPDGNGLPEFVRRTIRRKR